MLRLARLVERIAHHVGGPRVLALTVICLLATIAVFARQSPSARDSVDVNGIVQETLILREQISKEGITLTRRLARARPPIVGDANALQQAFMNLLLNAREELRDGGKITMETDASADPSRPVRIVVRDTGPGVPREILPKIFDPFFTTKPSGTGLGLSISHGIVRDHQSTLDVRPEPGAIFTLTFPAAVEVPA